MKQIIAALILLSFSTLSFAGYQCNFILSQDGKRIAYHTEFAGDAIRAGLGIDLHTEVEKGSLEDHSGYEDQKLVIFGQISGYPADRPNGQTMSFTVRRLHIGTKANKFFEYKDHNAALTKEVQISRKEFKTVEFENYEIFASCDFEEEESVDIYAN